MLVYLGMPTYFAQYEYVLETKLQISYSCANASAIVCSNFMRQQAMGERMVFNRPIPVNRIVNEIADSTSPLPQLIHD